jgi:hypothetical protein
MLDDLRSVKVLRAADILSNLATLPSPIKRRSPFIICALAICALVHSGACFKMRLTDREESMLVRVQLSLGGLNVLGEVWPLGASVKRQILSLYRIASQRQKVQT